jgi:hypothetical protein
VARKLQVRTWLQHHTIRVHAANVHADSWLQGQRGGDCPPAMSAMPRPAPPPPGLPPVQRGGHEEEGLLDPHRVAITRSGRVSG